MATKTKKATASAQAVSEETKVDLSNLPKLPVTLDTLQFLRTAKNKSDGEIHSKLNLALAECKKQDCVLMLERVMLHIGDLSRQHNILKELNIKSDKGGAQERTIFRSCMRWWEKHLPESFAKNLNVFVEFTLYENLMYYQNRTDRKTGNVLSTEILLPMPKLVHEFLASQIRKGKDLNLIARHLPKYYPSNSTSRTTSKLVFLKKGQTNFKYKLPKKSWVKINGEFVDLTKEFITLNQGDKISYPRKKQSVAINRQDTVRQWIEGLCKVLNWDFKKYQTFRSTQNTPEQLFSSQNILKLPQVDFMKMLDRLTTSQRFRVAKMVAYKDKITNDLVAKEKWAKLGEWYIAWEKNQEKIADKLRAAAVSGDIDETEKLTKDFKVKSTGLQTIDILSEMFKGQLNDMQINNTYQSLIEKMDLIANVFPIVDGSGSMSDELGIRGSHLKYRDIVYAMCIAFSTRNPVDKFRNTYEWFSNDFTICGRSSYLNNSPNQFVDKKRFEKEVPEYEVISAGKTFTENFQAMRRADKEEYAATNMFAVIEFFVSLVKTGQYSVEELPTALLYLSDNENNKGNSPSQAVTLAASIGWRPLQIFWGIKNVPESIKRDLKGVPNSLFVGGFEESVLSQILRGIKGGSINPEVELWSIYNDPRYSVLTVA